MKYWPCILTLGAGMLVIQGYLSNPVRGGDQSKKLMRILWLHIRFNVAAKKSTRREKSLIQTKLIGESYLLMKFRPLLSKEKKVINILVKSVDLKQLL